MYGTTKDLSDGLIQRAVYATDLSLVYRDDQRDLETVACPMLLLPGEIRNRIYELALTVEHQLYFKPADSEGKARFHATDSDHNVNPVEFNRIKYVCRKLYKETAGLEVKLNTLEFHSKKPGRLFLKFIRTCAQTKLSWLTNVHLTNRGFDRRVPLFEDSVHTLCAVTDFCKQNPQVTIKYIPGDFRAGNGGASDRLPDRFICFGVWLMLAIRGKEVSGVLHTQFDIWYKVIKAQVPLRVNTSGVIPMEVPNFRFWHADNEQNVRDMLKKHGCGGFWLGHAERWFKNGI